MESPDPPLGRVTETGEKVGVPAKHPPGLPHVGSQLIQVPAFLAAAIQFL